MKDLALTWDFLIRHSPESYLLPSPWHLLLALFLLGLLAATGLHHLAGHTYQLYQLRGRTSPWLAFPTLAVFLVSVQVMVGAYLFAGQAEGVVAVALSGPARQPTIEDIGKTLLEPAFAGLPGKSAETAETDSAMLGKTLRGFSAETLRERYLLRLAEQEAEVVRRAQSEREVQIKGFDPPGKLIPPPAEPSAQLSALALRWVTDPDQQWPSGQMHSFNQETQPGGNPAAGTPTEPEMKPGSAPGPSAPAVPTPATQPPATEEAQLPGAGKTAPDQQAAKNFDTKQEASAEEKTQAGTGTAETPPGENGDRTLGQEETFPIQQFVAGLVAEIRPGAALAREDWEHIAGTRFVEWVLVPTLVWQVRYLALLILVLAAAFDVLYLFFLLQLRRWLPPPERRRRSDLML